MQSLALALCPEPSQSPQLETGFNQSRSGGQRQVDMTLPHHTKPSGPCALDPSRAGPGKTPQGTVSAFKWAGSPATALQGGREAGGCAGNASHARRQVLQPLLGNLISLDYQVTRPRSSTPSTAA